MKDFDKVNQGKAIDEMVCLFTRQEIENTIKEMYPNMKQSEVNYHIDHLEDCDSLKVALDKQDLIEAIEQQVE